MPDILIRNVKPEVVERLKAQARRHGRSLQGELKTVIESAAGAGGPELSRVLEKWRKTFAGRKVTSSAEMIRQDRQR